VRVSFGGTTVLDGVDVSVGPGDRLGIVAPNGVGKSTLLKVLAGDLQPEGGTVIRAPQSATVIRLAQEPDVRPGETLFEHLARRTGVAAAQAAFQAATEALSGGGRPAEDAYSAALDRWLAVGAADLRERAELVTADLGLEADLLRRGAAQLSGGQEARLALAAVLLARPDILLLDEPTNNLDDAGLARLEAHLRGGPAGLVMVSHDRALLAAVIDRVLEIDEFTRRGTEFGGGWDAYVAEQAAARQRAVEAYDAYETERARLVDSAREKRQWATAGAQRAANPRRQPDGDKNRKAAWIEGAQNSGAAAGKLDRAIERLDRDAPDEVRDPWRLRLTIGETRRSGDIVVSLREAVISRGDVRLGPLNVEIGWAERIRITGPNGAGKTTLVDALIGRAPLDSGHRYAGPGVVFGELDQLRREFATDVAIGDVVRAAAGLTPVDVRSLLAKFRLRGVAALRPARALSPGERTRAGLALLQATGVNCLVLDEPTNHLDIEAIEQLEQALEAYSGTLVLITHDRRLAEAISVHRTIDVPSLPHLTD